MAGGDNKIMLPQRQLFKELYCNPESETFGNAYKSAIEAGFEPSYAKTITGRSLEWVEEIIRDHSRLQKAEKVLDEMLDLNTSNTRIVGEEHIEFEDPQLIRIKQDTAKFIAKTMGRKKYAERVEQTGPEGESLYDPLREALTELAHDTFTTEDPETGQSDVQKRSRRSSRTHTDTVHDLRAHIQKALQTGEPQSPHPIREESDSSSRDSNQGSDVSREVGDRGTE